MDPEISDIPENENGSHSTLSDLVKLVSPPSWTKWKIVLRRVT